MKLMLRIRRRRVREARRAPHWPSVSLGHSEAPCCRGGLGGGRVGGESVPEALWLEGRSLACLSLTSLQGSFPFLGDPCPSQASLPSSCCSCASPCGRRGGGGWVLSGGRRLFIYNVTILMYLLGGMNTPARTIKLKDQRLWAKLVHS